MAAAVGSLITRSTLRPAMVPASLVACRCASLKYAGTVMTACFTCACVVCLARRQSVEGVGKTGRIYYNPPTEPQSNPRTSLPR